MMINTEKLRSPQYIFIIYIVVSSILILLYRFIFPSSLPPLPMYAGSWRFMQGFLEIFNLFPALALSALVIPFGLASFEENYQSFSEIFFKRLLSSVVTAIAAAIIYGLIFFLIAPLVKNHEDNMRFTGSLYQLAKNNAQESARAGEWFDASQFLAICDRIWHNSTELELLKRDVALNLDRSENERRENYTIDIYPLSSEQPIDATMAMTMAQTAFDEERYFDSHWLAGLAIRLAGQRNIVQVAAATQLESEAWDMIASLAPNQRETHIFNLYHLKLSGYQAMQTGQWVQAYYIFQQLIGHTPNDPDAVNFLAASEQGAALTAFFIDEVELSVGEILNGAVFSLPSEDGRVVLRFSSLTLADDVSYGFGFDYMGFDNDMNLKTSGTARYVKLLPFTLDESPKILVLTQALDRYNEDRSFRSQWQLGSEPAGGILLDIDFEEFLLLSKVRRGLSNLQIRELFTAARSLEKAGYINQIFEAEILNRLGSALFFLPLSIFIIIIAWRYRARQKPRYLFVLLLPVLPVIFHGLVFLYRSVFNTLGIWLVISAGFSAAIIIYIVALAVTLFISLITLSAQHS
ncbi:MAG: hypothetical protein FWD47_05935 [Treponema sp.]|nr:hypothetical protein [Treponema sp.]